MIVSYRDENCLGGEDRQDRKQQQHAHVVEFAARPPCLEASAFLLLI